MQEQKLEELLAAVNQLKEEVATLSGGNRKKNYYRLANLTDAQLRDIAKNLAFKLRDFAGIWRYQDEVNVGERYFSEWQGLPENERTTEREQEIWARRDAARQETTDKYKEQGEDMIKLANEVRLEVIRRSPSAAKNEEIADKKAAVFFRKALHRDYKYYDLEPMADYMEGLVHRIL